MNDRFGIGWRPELAAGILSNLERIDIVEVIADDYFDAPTDDAPRAQYVGRASPGSAARRNLGWLQPLRLINAASNERHA